MDLFWVFIWLANMSLEMLRIQDLALWPQTLRLNFFSSLRSGVSSIQSNPSYSPVFLMQLHIDFVAIHQNKAVVDIVFFILLCGLWHKISVWTFIAIVIYDQAAPLSDQTLNLYSCKQWIYLGMLWQNECNGRQLALDSRSKLWLPSCNTARFLETDRLRNK